MSANKSRVFPFIYDEAYARGNNWTAISRGNQQKHAHHEQRLPPRVLDSEPWPDSGILVTTNYQPLEVFSPPNGKGIPTRGSEMDPVNEVAILMKDLELGAQMGEHLDRARYRFLQNLHTSVIQNLRKDYFKSRIR
ncbi:hypothetical protein DPEC_G00252360 [Dallia pectoralis]|uniref:Uncharacterized protein n=1 Tax=Dallia pectoralis TaxID=75939 RepID=A0ACC2FU02_DALPE|nr:hypothetical protein DPEC_G00252360 [Dallia pectoralis]